VDLGFLVHWEGHMQWCLFAFFLGLVLLWGVGLAIVVADEGLGRVSWIVATVLLLAIAEAENCQNMK